MTEVNKLIELCGKLKAQNGFTSDESFIRAWVRDPERWKYVFTVRQTLINAMMEHLS